jgi:hypothetical protein
MNPLPWHPKLVHLPLALAFLVPALGVLLWIATARSWLPRRAWLLYVLAQLGLLLGAWAASATGEEDEDLVERFVPEAALEAHEEAAEAFLWAWALALGGGLLPLLVPRRRVGPAAGAAIAAARGWIDRLHPSSGRFRRGQFDLGVGRDHRHHHTQRLGDRDLW